ncbi:hypothetical protein [Candidatus Trichorickettsia mobilis]|uniref:hypothetical protein n=1 Tax=Candidatus Trichorickettsia mobilis TaxID=1346319 RepID=UPI002931D077|nr:hypothetical protein [Candidatus Trichorickettsia mobilis]
MKEKYSIDTMIKAIELIGKDTDILFSINGLGAMTKVGQTKPIEHEEIAFNYLVTAIAEDKTIMTAEKIEKIKALGNPNIKEFVKDAYSEYQYLVDISIKTTLDSSRIKALSSDDACKLAKDSPLLYREVVNAAMPVQPVSQATTLAQNSLGVPVLSSLPLPSLLLSKPTPVRPLLKNSIELLCSEDARNLAKNSPNEYKELLEVGKLNPEALKQKLRNLTKEQNLVQSNSTEGKQPNIGKYTAVVNTKKIEQDNTQSNNQRR